MRKSTRYSVFLMVVFLTTATLYAHEAKTLTPTLHSRGDTIQPEYPGGINAFRKYITDSLRTPLISRLNGNHKGTTRVEFVVDKQGKVTKAKIKQSVDKSIDKEVLRLVKASLPWKPGSINGEPKSIKYTLPITSSQEEMNIKNAYVLHNGTLLSRKQGRKLAKKTFFPVQTLGSEFTTAVFGKEYNRPMVVVGDIMVNQWEHNSKGFERTLKRLQHVDSTKVNLYVDGRRYPLDEWSTYLNTDSVQSIMVTKTPDSQPDKRVGNITLVTKHGQDRFIANLTQRNSDKQEFIEMVQNYRAGNQPLDKRSIQIDNYHFNTRPILDSLDLSIIKRVRIIRPENTPEAQRKHHPNGWINLYTTYHHPDRRQKDRAHLDELLSKHLANESIEDYVIFRNNRERISFQVLSRIPKEAIRNVHTLTKEEAQALFGKGEEYAIIYLNIDHKKTE